jgi:hypothetical protein
LLISNCAKVPRNKFQFIPRRGKNKAVSAQQTMDCVAAEFIFGGPGSAKERNKL